MIDNKITREKWQEPGGELLEKTEETTKNRQFRDIGNI